MQSTFVPFKQNSSPDATVPDWRLQKPFGAGLKRKHVKFVPASTETSDGAPAPPTIGKRTGAEVSDFYLSLFGLASPLDGSIGASTSASTPPIEGEEAPEKCPTCVLPVTDAHTHATSTAHQSSLPHSDPPHPYDRSSLGLKILMESGWDPDAKVGLGRTGEGMRYPVKAVPKDDKLGVGIKPRKGEVPMKAVKKRVGVKEAKKGEKEGRARRIKLMRELGGGVDVERILNAKME